MLKKLYDKNELWIALPFIAVYCMTNIPIRGEYGDESVWMMIANIVIALLATIFIMVYRLEDRYGLNRLPKNAKRYLYFIPMIVLVTCNFWGGFSLAYQGLPMVFACVSMILIGYIEEVIFRGFLFRAVEKNKGIRPAIIISAVTFGIGHILNLVSQPGLDTFLQVVYAIAFGFMFAYVFHKCKSLWPCIILHSVVDLTSKFGGNDRNSYLVTVIVSVICIGYAVYLHRLPDKE